MSLYFSPLKPIPALGNLPLHRPPESPGQRAEMGLGSAWAMPGLIRAVPMKLVAQVCAFPGPTGLSPCAGVSDRSSAAPFKPPLPRRNLKGSPKKLQREFIYGKIKVTWPPSHASTYLISILLAVWQFRARGTSCGFAVAAGAGLTCVVWAGLGSLIHGSAHRPTTSCPR